MTTRRRIPALALAAAMLLAVALTSAMTENGVGELSVPEGCTLYEMEHEGSPVRFYARDTAQVKQYSSSITIYPVDGVYSEANVSIMQTPWDSGDDLETVQESAASYYFDYKENYSPALPLRCGAVQL